MIARGLIIFCLCWGCIIKQQSSPTDHQDVIQSLMEIDVEPILEVISNQIPCDTLGGHLQGIQYITQNGKVYAVISGSSQSQSYLALLQTGASGRVIDIKKILDKPFKHAGGFQIFQDYLAIGIEDNELRNHSYLMIFDVSNVNNIPEKPVIKIERKGDFERATAGCVALTRISDRWLMVVGDWNTRHLDFYASSNEQLANFKLIYSITTKDLIRSDWIDDQWRAYQNINFLINQDRLYLAGMTSDEQHNNIIDLYEVNWNASDSFDMQKIASKSLVNRGGDFVWSAGLSIQGGLIQQIASCNRNLAETLNLFIYK